MDIKKLSILNLSPKNFKKKYIFLRQDQSLSIIFAIDLEEYQEIQLLQFLKKNKKMISWVICDLTGTNINTHTNHIYLEGVKVSRET